MTDQLTAATTLLAAAASLGFIHTLTGPDHYVPFIAMARIGRWSLTKTIVVTILCGLGHVLSSVLLGMLGLFVGIAVLHLESFESARGTLAGWLLLAFGVAYLALGIRQAVRNRPHAHVHAHADGTVHTHLHGHHDSHAHVHHTDDAASVSAQMTPWILFTIFVFGPCEPLIPLLMYPAAESGFATAALVAAVFSLVTIGTMLAIVLAGYYGTALLPRPGATWQRYGHAAGGAIVTICGAAILLGL